VLCAQVQKILVKLSQLGHDTSAAVPSLADTQAPKPASPVELQPCSLCKEEEADGMCTMCCAPICVWCGHWYGASFPSVCHECLPVEARVACGNQGECGEAARGKCSACGKVVCYDCGIWKFPTVWCGCGAGKN